MIVTLNGADGSGKSSILDAITRATQGEITHYHSRPGNIVPKKSADKQIRYVDCPSQVPKRRVALQWAKIVLFVFEFQAFAIWHKLTARRRLVILERSLIDLYVHPDRYGLENRHTRSILVFLTEWYCDLNILLIGDAQRMADRKPELKASEIATLNYRYRAVLGRKTNRLLVIDTTAETMTQSRDRVTSRLAKLFPSSFNA